MDVSLARKIDDPQIAIDVQRGRTRTHDASIRRDVAELQRLVRTLHRHVAVGVEDRRRDLEILDEQCRIGRAEPHLRAVAALLVTLDTYQNLRGSWFRETRGGPAPPARNLRGSWFRETRDGPAPPAKKPESGRANASRQERDPTAITRGAVGAAPTEAQPAGPTLVQPVNGHPINGAPPSALLDTDLAAAAARYIARDLAARQLSEFTSAEGYRLARALARFGDAEAPVERLLTEANQVRLHPMPLADALSHSTH
jgi:hypothetical protein